MDDTTFSVEALSELFYKNLIETEDLGGHLEHVKVIGPFIMRAALIRNLRRFDDELKREVPASWELRDRRRRTIITLLGEITYFRRVYLDEYGNRRYLLDEVLGVSSYRRIESAAFLWIVAMASNVSYEKTAKAFLEATGVQITRQTVMRCVHREGQLLAGHARENTGPLISAPVLFMEFDGICIHLQSKTKGSVLPRTTYKAQYRKKTIEMKVGVIYAAKKGNRRIGAFHWVGGGTPEDFFSEGLSLTGSIYDMGELDYLKVASDAASWCKSHGLDAGVEKDTVVVSTLDVYHVNQRVYKAFTKDCDRSFFLGLLYSKDYSAFFKALEKRMEDEPSERMAQREELYSYIEGNLDWLSGASLSRLIRERLAGELPCVFADRPFYDHLCDLLALRRYKRFLRDLERIAGSCAEALRYDYSCFLEDAREAIRLIKLYGPMSLGTIEGTNAKVYAARLKVWGCSWSERGALAMMRIRARLASGLGLIACPYRGWMSDRERARREKHGAKSASDIPESSGVGWEPPQAHVALTAHLPARYYYLLNLS